MSKSSIHLEDELNKYFGYKSFRSNQKEIIQHTLENKDCVVLMPTGGGKSICFQLPAMLSEGLTLVISPLIALMKDQVESLKSNGINAEFLNSSQDAIEEQSIISEVKDGKVKLLYISPERLFAQHFHEFLSSIEISRIAIDEAHCVSSWGHHFRPEYSRLSILKDWFPNVPTIALTATADKAVRTDIAELLGMKNSEIFISSFDRPNISLTVLPGQKKWEQIKNILQRHMDNTGIIYCSSRKATEDLALKLQDMGLRAKPYHAGLNSQIRSKTQEDFLNDKVQLIVATIAFGMGIDKANVRYVIHYNMPGNLDSYYQEFGRAGRDGNPAEAILFYSYRDVQTHMGFIEDNDNPQYKEILIHKLNRMQEYAEAQQCRRTILLTYFSEFPENVCGNCDVCHNPPVYFDGTKYTQMALSAVIRSREQIGMSTLLDVLKARYSEEVTAKQLDKIKTFGIGRDLTYFDWQVLIQQMVQLGAIELDYKDSYHLKVTPLGKKILYDGETIQLVKAETIKERQKVQKEIKIKVIKEKVDASLFATLKALRKKLASEVNKPAFVVFSDASLKDMCKKEPSNISEFKQVSGVGDHKAKRYAEIFINAIADYKRPVSNKKEKTGGTYQTTFELVEQGLTLQEIAKKRNLKTNTILVHIQNLIEQGKEINTLKFINPEDFKKVKKAYAELGDIKETKPYFEFLNGEIDYGTIHLSLSLLKSSKDIS